MQGESGQRESDGISSFFADRNTAVRGAEVHILPLNFPLKISSIWTAGTGVFYNEYFKDGFFDRVLNCSIRTTRAEGRRLAQKGYARCTESILHNLKLWAMMQLVLHVREPADWRATFCVGTLTIISIM